MAAGSVALAALLAVTMLPAAPPAAPVCDGKSAAVSEFQVICGAIASMRSS